MFVWLWLIGWSALALPLAALMLQGWAPRRHRHRALPWATQVRGIAMLVLWAGGMLTPLVLHSDLDREDASFFASVVPAWFTLFAAGLMCGAQRAEGFYRRAIRSATPGRAPHGDRSW